MTDNEIIKALNCCQTGCCGSCPLYDASVCIVYLAQLSLDLIKRQQEYIEELEVLNGLKDELIKALIAGQELLQKQFAEKMGRIVEQLEELEKERLKIYQEYLDGEDYRIASILNKAIEIVKGVMGRERSAE